MEIRIDRILSDILQWIGQVAWWREQKVKRRPYEKIQTWRMAGLGCLHRVVRPPDLCPRDVGTYIFEPFRYNVKTIKDIHILCDHLEGMSRPRGRQKKQVCTHRVTILLADHWIGADGRYAANELFSLNDDLQGQSSRRDLHIACILHQVAFAVAQASAGGLDFTTFDFLRELDNAKKVCMRQDYTHTLNLPKPTGHAIARPVDGGKSARVRFD
jgi:hypothetical protein